MHKTGILSYFQLLNNKGQNEKKTFMMLKKYVNKQTYVQTHIYIHCHTHAPTHMHICARTDILLPLKDVVQV